MKVSLDGRWLVFDANRSGNQDIYRMRLPDGEPEQVTSDPADNFSPDISPDNRWIAFHSFRNGNRDLFLAPAEGGPAVSVVATPLQERAAIWSPDGTQLLFVQYEERRSNALRVAVTARRRDGTWDTVRVLTPSVVAQACGWSPDGREIANIHTDGSMWVLPLDGRGARRILAPTGNPTQSGAEEEDCTWARRGRTILFRRRDAEGQYGISAIPAAGGEPKLLVRFDDPARPSRRSWIAADSTRLYFLVDDRQSDIWVAELSRLR